MLTCIGLAAGWIGVACDQDRQTQTQISSRRSAKHKPEQEVEREQQ